MNGDEAEAHTFGIQRSAFGALSSARLNPLKTIISTRIGGNIASAVSVVAWVTNTSKC